MLLMLCFFISTVSVPESDFTLLGQLPALYHHCKETEDEDMSFMDFITDHLININSIFNMHDTNDAQKPHQPFRFEHLQHIVAYEPVYSNLDIAIPLFQHRSIYLLRAVSIHSDYISCMFHPPDLARHYQATLYL
jgi:hypothetical protein